MTQHACRLIIQFMAACCGKSKTRQEAEGTQVREEKPRHVPSNTVPLTRVHAILERMSRGEDDETVPVRPKKNKSKTPEAPGEETSGADVDAPALRQSTQIQSSMRTTARLWPAHTREWPADVVDVRNTSLSTRPRKRFNQAKPPRQGLSSSPPGPCQATSNTSSSPARPPSTTSVGSPSRPPPSAPVLTTHR